MATSSVTPPKTAALALAAIGVVYGDIGTSPLYAVRESLEHSHGVAASPANVLGVISLIFWSLVIVICIKYLFLVVRADHQGEGGILALTALVGATERNPGRLAFLTALGLFGTALLFGDGMITPAISVLSAIEGLQFATPRLAPMVLPLTVAILIGLFSVQSRGTANVGKIFGPLVLVWFATLTSLGVYQLVQAPEILWALNPYYGAVFFLNNGWNAFLVLGSVFLVVTGGEALYADMGHFGRRPVQLAWFSVAFPALMINYLGQGALLLRQPAAFDNPFYKMAPGWSLPFVILVATMATVIASQALISGVYSLSMQSVQLGYLPRIEIQHTSASERGQIYVPAMNWLLMLCCIGLVLGFGSSSKLAAAYGVAVTATMVITTLLFFFFLRQSWNWPLWKASLSCGFFLSIEFMFFGANVVKIPQGGWFPIVIGAMIYLLMRTWHNGRKLLFRRMQTRSIPLSQLQEQLAASPPTRVPGTAIFMYGNREGSPPALLANLRHNQTLHQRVIILSVETAEHPFVKPEMRIEQEGLPLGFHRVVLRFGFLETPNVPAALGRLELDGEALDVNRCTFFLGRETLIPRRELDSGMSFWQEHLFAFMAKNATDPTSFFGIHPERVVELGTQLEI